MNPEVIVQCIVCEKEHFLRELLNWDEWHYPGSPHDFSQGKGCPECSWGKLLLLNDPEPLVNGKIPEEEMPTIKLGIKTSARDKAIEKARTNAEKRKVATAPVLMLPAPDPEDEPVIKMVKDDIAQMEADLKGEDTWDDAEFDDDDNPFADEPEEMSLAEKLLAALADA